MEEDSSNGAGPDKRNWRERLGIGAKELPKLSDEFRDEPQMTPPPPAGTAKPAPRVTKPAPMAPRVAPKPATDAAQPAAASAPAVPPSLSRATPKVPDNAAQDALAEKLRAQRAAAERLAEQRVQAARNRAESKPRVDPVPSRPLTPPQRPVTPSGRTPSVAPPTAGARPKFSFADDNRSETPQRPSLGGAAPLTPPRPALGGERGQPPFLRPSTGVNGSLGSRPQPAFRPTSTEGGYASSPRLQAPGAARPGLGSEVGSYGTSRLPTRRPPALDPYARQPTPEPREYPEDDFDDEGRAPPRLGRPGVAGRGRTVDDDYDEVFEDDQAPRGRAAARDYPAAYNDGEEGFADEPRRSSGPWLLLLALLAAAVLTGAVVWFYSDSVKNFAGVGSSSSSSGTTPVVPAPADPAKVAAPDTNGGDGQTEAPAARKKQIYDRIVGEQEVTGQMQPTEETPVTPEAQPAADSQPVDQVPKIEPAAGSANPIPVPDAPEQGTGQGLPDPEPPPPLPIPGSDQQGNLGLKGGQQVAAASAQPELGSTPPPPPPPPSSAQTSSSDADLPPPPEKATDGAALVSGAGSAADMAAAASKPTASAAVVTPEPDTEIVSPAPVKATPAKPAAQQTTPAQTKKKPPAKKTTTTKQPDYDNLGSQPVVLVPPSKQAMAQSQSAPATAVTTAPAAPADQPAAQATTPQKRKNIFDLFNGGGSGSTTAQTAAPATTQVASAATQTKQAPAATQQKAAPPPAAPAEPQAAAGSSGYRIQLASFRTDSEAKAEYSRLAGAYPSIVGPLKSQIRQTTVGGSTRYQLALGPLPTRGDATRVCGELIAAGESDCIVRGP